MKKLKSILLLTLLMLACFALVACGEPGEKGDQGEPGANGADGVGIVSIAKSSTSGNVDTYIITYTNNTTAQFVKSGQDGDKMISVKIHLNTFYDAIHNFTPFLFCR